MTLINMTDLKYENIDSKSSTSQNVNFATVQISEEITLDISFHYEFILKSYQGPLKVQWDII